MKDDDENNPFKPKPIIYIVAPNPNGIDLISDFRYEVVSRLVEALVAQGNCVPFSPLLHSDPTGGLPRDLISPERRCEIDQYILEMSDRIWVLCVDGWRHNVIIKAEILYAQSLEIPVEYVDVSISVNPSVLRLVNRYTAAQLLKWPIKPLPERFKTFLSENDA